MTIPRHTRKSWAAEYAKTRDWASPCVGLYNPEFCQKAYNWLSAGHNLTTLSPQLGASLTRVLQWTKEFPAFGRAVEQGKAAYSSYCLELLNDAAAQQPTDYDDRGRPIFDIKYDSKIVMTLAKNFSGIQDIINISEETAAASQQITVVKQLQPGKDKQYQSDEDMQELELTQDAALGLSGSDNE